MFITGSQLFSIFCSAFTVLRGVIGPLSYILTVTYIEGLKIIFVFNMYWYWGLHLIGEKN